MEESVVFSAVVFALAAAVAAAWLAEIRSGLARSRTACDEAWAQLERLLAERGGLGDADPARRAELDGQIEARGEMYNAQVAGWNGRLVGFPYALVARMSGAMRREPWSPASPPAGQASDPVPPAAA